MSRIQNYRRTSAAQLLNRLFEQPALVAQVRALPGAVLAKLIDHVGLEDAGEIVALASTEQLARAFDEDLWRAERAGGDETFQPQRFGLWLHVLSEAGDEFVAGRLAALPRELLVLAVHRLALVLDIDRLALEFSEADEDLSYTEKALESTLHEEWEEFRLIARDAASWDVLWAALVALDRDHHAILREVLERCAVLDAEFIEDNGGLYEVLTAEEMLENDLGAERAERRAGEGFVAPSDARAFLALCKQDADLLTRDAITQAYFRELARPQAAQRRPTSATPPPSPELLQVLADAQVMPTAEAQPLRLSAGTSPESTRPQTSFERALRELAESEPRLAEQRLEELAYLSNVLIAGSSRGGQKPRPIEALERALRICSVGLERAALDVRFAGPHGNLLARVSADVLFRLGFRGAE